MEDRSMLEEIGPAEFFYRNKSLAGFDNPARATFSIVRELIENGLDACEEARKPPEIVVSLKQDSGGEGSSKASEEPSAGIYCLSVKDNGTGLRPKEIPKAFGQVLVSSKYKPIQSRGTFGLGGSMALLYGQITTNKPFEITSSLGGLICRFAMKIDIQNNRPIIVKREVLDAMADSPFTEVKVHFRGDYPRARPRIMEYLRQTAMITPYANITFDDTSGGSVSFLRNASELPPLPEEALPHPEGIDLELLQRMLRESGRTKLISFLEKEFQKIGRRTALQLLSVAGLDPNQNPKALTARGIEALFKAFRAHKAFLPPDASVLSPLGEELLVKGIEKELEPEFVHAVQRPPISVWGHAALVETALAYGGGIKPSSRVQLYRFANRIPLLYDSSSDVSYLVAKKIKWAIYGIRSLEDEPMALFVHIASTKIPFKTVGKEFIANEANLAKEIELGFRECARRQKLYLSKKRHKERVANRYQTFRRYYEVMAGSIEDILGERPPIERVLEKIEPPGDRR